MQSSQAIDMSAFSALAGFDGDEGDIVQNQQRKAADDAAALEQEAEAAKLRFSELRAQGTSNWADDDDEEFFSSPVRRMSGDRRASDSIDSADGLPLVDLEALDDAKVSRKERKGKDAAKVKEEEELDALLAGLNTDAKEAAPAEGGLSKAAAKRAKKKAREAEGASKAEEAPAPEVAAAEQTNGEEETATAGKSAEEVKAMLKARAEAGKKKKSGGKGGSAAAVAAAAAAAESKARSGTKKKKDKSHYNQQPA